MPERRRTLLARPVTRSPSRPRLNQWLADAATRAAFQPRLTGREPEARAALRRLGILLKSVGAGAIGATAQLASGCEQRAQLSGAIERHQVVAATDMLLTNEDLRH